MQESMGEKIKQTNIEGVMGFSSSLVFPFSSTFNIYKIYKNNLQYKEI